MVQLRHVADKATRCDYFNILKKATFFSEGKKCVLVSLVYSSLRMVLHSNGILQYSRRFEVLYVHGYFFASQREVVPTTLFVESIGRVITQRSKATLKVLLRW